MSLVNQMLRDLELRQSGPAVTVGGLLCDIGAVHEPLPSTARRSPWRPVGVVLAIAGGTALLATRPDPGWLAWPTQAGAGVTRDPAAFVSVVRSAPTIGPAPPAQILATSSTATVAELPARRASRPQPIRRRVSAPDADVEPRAATTTVASAPAGLPRLRLSRELGALPAALMRAAPAAGTAAARLASKPGKSTLPVELSAVAARFDSDFAARLKTAGSLAAAAPARGASAVPAPGVVATKPMKVKTAVRQSPLDQAKGLYATANAALAAGRREDAQRYLTAALQADASHVQARRLLATTLLQAGQFAVADRVLAEAPVAAPEIASLRARALVELGRDAEALAVLEPTLNARADINQFAFHAALMQRLGDHAGASAAYRRVLAAQPGNGVWWMGLGISLEALQEPAEARLAYDRARASGRLQATLVEFVEQRLASL